MHIETDTVHGPTHSEVLIVGRFNSESEADRYNENLNKFRKDHGITDSKPESLLLDGLKQFAGGL